MRLEVWLLLLLVFLVLLLLDMYPTRKLLLCTSFALGSGSNAAPVGEAGKALRSEAHWQTLLPLRTNTHR
jgi:hypothetical protein